VETENEVEAETGADQTEEENSASHEENQKENASFRTWDRCPKVTKKTDDVMQEALQCMRSLSEAVTKQDAFSISGKHIAASLQSSNRPQLEISVAQHHISELLFCLQIGSFASQIPRVYQTYQQNVPHINILAVITNPTQGY
jgi:hypothetical protein